MLVTDAFNLFVVVPYSSLAISANASVAEEGYWVE